MSKIVTIVFLLLTISISGVAQESAATLISDFDAAGIENWWSYSDDLGSTFTAALDTETVFDGQNALRLDFAVLASGYAGIGFDYGTPFDWRAGEGITLQLRASKPGIPIQFVLHLADATQTSEQTPGVSPFSHAYVTPEGSENGWVTVNLPWSGFERLFWMGDAGITEFTAEAVGAFEIALEGLPDATNDGTIWVDNIRVISQTDLNQPPSYEEFRGEIQPIRVNNIGYRPADAKQFVTGIPFETFAVVDTATGETVFSGEALSWGMDTDSEELIYRGDFSPLVAAGEYRIVIEGVGESYPFAISATPYNEVLVLGTRAFYLQRSGIAINDAAISGFTLEAGHTEPAILWDDPSAAPVDVSGGWYDAGDYGRYIPTAAFAVNQLMLAYEANPAAFPDGLLDIPESGNGVSDLLDEIRWELDWMLRMQRADGAVHHKVTTRSFPAYGTLAADDDSQMYLFGVSSADAAFFASVMAQASRVYADADPDFAANALDAAQRAWDWLSQHPEQFPPGGFQNPPVSEYPMQGGYDFVGVETMPRLWASAELFNATGEARYEEAFGDLFEGFDGHHTMSWANGYPLALYAYLTSENADASIAAKVAGIFQQQAAEIYAVAQQTGYGVALDNDIEGYQYTWGSNQITLAHGLYLMLANELSPQAGYTEAAQAQIHYLLGLNPLARTYFGGTGENPVLYPHHNVSYHFGRSVPGFVGEGANSQSAGGDAVLMALWESGAPASHSYVDSWDSWASNEPTIDANATFVALLAYVMRE